MLSFVRSKKKMRQFPNSYLSLRSLFDLLFTVLLLMNQFHRHCNRTVAFLSQFSFCGSLLCYLAIPWSLYSIIMNPFADTSQPAMRMGGIVVLSAVSGVVLLMTGTQGNGLGFCWICFQAKEPVKTGFFDNPARLLLVVTPMLSVLLIR
jgi:hypothetical protein